MNTEKPKLTLPLQVGQKVTFYRGSNQYDARVLATDIRGGEYPVIVAYYNEGQKMDCIAWLRLDGKAAAEEYYGYLSDPRDPRDDLIPGEAVWVRDCENTRWKLRIFKKPGINTGIYVEDERGPQYSHYWNYWRPYEHPTK